MINGRDTVMFKFELELCTLKYYQSISFFSNGENVSRIIGEPKDIETLKQVKRILNEEADIGCVKNFPFK